MLRQPTRDGGITHVVMTKIMRRIDGASTRLSFFIESNICGPVASPVSAVMWSTRFQSDQSRSLRLPFLLHIPPIHK